MIPRREFSQHAELLADAKQHFQVTQETVLRLVVPRGSTFTLFPNEIFTLAACPGLSVIQRGYPLP
jgi:hypothetical protein